MNKSDNQSSSHSSAVRAPDMRLLSDIAVALILAACLYVIGSALVASHFVVVIIDSSPQSHAGNVVAPGSHENV